MAFPWLRMSDMEEGEISGPEEVEPQQPRTVETKEDPFGRSFNSGSHQAPFGGLQVTFANPERDLPVKKKRF